MSCGRTDQLLFVKVSDLKEEVFILCNAFLTSVAGSDGSNEMVNEDIFMKGENVSGLSRTMALFFNSSSLITLKVRFFILSRDSAPIFPCRKMNDFMPIGKRGM